MKQTLPLTRSDATMLMAIEQLASQLERQAKTLRADAIQDVLASHDLELAPTIQINVVGAGRPERLEYDDGRGPHQRPATNPPAAAP